MYNPSSGEQKRFLEKVSSESKLTSQQSLSGILIQTHHMSLIKRTQAKPYMPPHPLIGPLEATIIFKLKRPRSHYRSGK